MAINISEMKEWLMAFYKQYPQTEPIDVNSLSDEQIMHDHRLYSIHCATHELKIELPRTYTMTEHLQQYCQDNKLEMPYGHRLLRIGLVVAEMVRQAEITDVFKKEIGVQMIVNSYPAEALPILDKTFELYFKKNRDFRILAGKQERREQRIRYFNYDIPAERAKYFESALKTLEIEIHQNHLSHGKAQYRIPVLPPPMMIKLGIVYQKFKAPYAPLPKQRNRALRDSSKTPDREKRQQY